MLIRAWKLRKKLDIPLEKLISQGEKVGVIITDTRQKLSSFDAGMITSSIDAKSSVNSSKHEIQKNDPKVEFNKNNYVNVNVLAPFNKNAKEKSKAVEPKYEPGHPTKEQWKFYHSTRKSLGMPYKKSEKINTAQQIYEYLIDLFLKKGKSITIIEQNFPFSNPMQEINFNRYKGRVFPVKSYTLTSEELSK